MTPRERDEAVEMLRYFWEEKGDPTRWTGWDAAKAEFPLIAKAWDAYLEARRRMALEVRCLE